MTPGGISSALSDGCGGGPGGGLISSAGGREGGGPAGGLIGGGGGRCTGADSLELKVSSASSSCI